MFAGQSGAKPHDIITFGLKIDRLIPIAGGRTGQTGRLRLEDPLVREKTEPLAHIVEATGLSATRSSNDGHLERHTFPDYVYFPPNPRGAPTPLQRSKPFRPE
jgi:hypothetical protein